MHRFAADAEWLQPLRSFTLRYGSRYVDQGLWRLPDGHGRDHLVADGVDGGQLVVVLEPDIDSGAISGWPETVGKFAYRNGGDLFEIAGSKHLNLVQSANGHVSKLTVSVADEIDVIGDRTRIECLEYSERWLGRERDDLAHVLEREPDLLAIRRCGNVRAERAGLDDPPNRLVVGHGDDDRLGIERGTDVAVAPVRRKDRHAWAAGRLDAGGFLIRHGIDH